ncbi:MAG: GNAT family N-acetyltransferase [Pseudomonadota bacterium]
MKFACETPPTGAAAQFAASLQNKLPTLATDRLILRAPRVTDFETYAEIACSSRGAYFGGPMSREDAWADFASMTGNWLLHGHGVWTIGAAAGPAGFVLLGFEPGDQEPELGFMLTPTSEGQRIAFEAAQAVLHHARTALGWDTLVSYIDPENRRALRLAQRLGGLLDGRVAESLVYRYPREVL